MCLQHRLMYLSIGAPCSYSMPPRGTVSMRARPRRARVAAPRRVVKKKLKMKMFEDLRGSVARKTEEVLTHLDLTHLDLKLRRMQERLVRNNATPVDIQTCLVRTLKQFHPEHSPAWVLQQVEKKCVCQLRVWRRTHPGVRHPSQIQHLKSALRFMIELAVKRFIQAETDKLSARLPSDEFYNHMEQQLHKIVRLRSHAGRLNDGTVCELISARFLLSSITWEWTVKVWEGKVSKPEHCPTFGQALRQ